MTTAEDARRVHMVRAGRVVAVLMIIPNIFVGIADALVGLATLACLPLAVALLAAGLAVFLTAAIRHMEAATGPQALTEPLLRRITHRPRRIMTAGDYRELREMERELGLDADATGRESDTRMLSSAGITGLDRPAAVPKPCTCPDGQPVIEIRAAGEVAPAARYCDECGRHRKTAAAAEKAAKAKRAAYGPEAHFAMLASEGRDFCIPYSGCTICARRLLGSLYYMEGESAYEVALQRWTDAQRGPQADTPEPR